MENLTVDCSTCVARDVGCDDCVISVLLGMPSDRSRRVALDPDERAALDALATSGLVPPLRLIAGEGHGEAEGGYRRRRA